MITIECDDCERTFEIEDEQAGGKVACPYCGDMNRVPEAQDSITKGPEAKGLPPDAGPEQDICTIHPAMFCAHPFKFSAIVILVLGGVTLAIAAKVSDNVANWLSWLGIVLTVAGALWWMYWYVASHLWIKLTISNKRTIRHEGIIRRHTSEVLHDHVRNVEIRQSLLQRILKVGYIGISSSGQDGIEIEVKDIPRPYAIKALIDEYRDM
ncbi:MAG: PH domain-containing protein [Planctomycetes bacterium]|nr:PH domain-containing protein [Planctomycetota bacterium]